ncbi:hypothetical protein CWE21_00020 [Pseudidiomarina aquimaris]|uniref:Uncharacterized protein n=1 Tax=Pseudidiomarina aquimaris TaxID=641841 RepID=A0A432XP73_9GAMM|nr:hypothetical protein [Pseudidiomarina aquimaris]RUO50525.1 hypothetical protein CWE21_00020 [Pseudidiomarina aquimaris]
MNNFADIGYPSKIRLVLILSILTIILSCSYAGEEARMTGQRITTVHMGDEIFEIPKNYLSPNVELPNKIEKENMIEISFFFPDFSGFAEGDSIATVGPYNSNQVTAFWTIVNAGGRLDANNSLKNALRFGLLERNKKLDIDGLTAYENLNGNGVTYHAQNNQGDDVLIHCTEGPVNSTCKLEYLDRASNRGVFASFDMKYLPRWLEINDKLLYLIKEWKA